MERTLLGLGLFLFGLGLILVIVAPIGKRKNNRCSAQTEGTLIDIRARNNSDGPLPSMNIYSYSVNGIEYQLRSTSINPNASKIGDRCSIWYDPKNPKNALEYRHNSNKLFNILLIIGIVLLLSPIILAVIVAGAQAQ